MAVEAGPKNGGACYARQGPHFMPFSHGYLFYAEAVLNFVEFKPQHCSRIAEAVFDTSSEFYDWSQVLAKVIRSRVAQLFQSLKQASAVTELRQQTCSEVSRPKTIATMFATVARRSAADSFPSRLRSATRPPSTAIYSSRFRPKKIWPPDFSKLSAKEQFRFEKKYKRRVKLATARPRWDKYVKMAQLVTVTGKFARLLISL